MPDSRIEAFAYSEVHRLEKGAEKMVVEAYQQARTHSLVLPSHVACLKPRIVQGELGLGSLGPETTSESTIVLVAILQ